MPPAFQINAAVRAARDIIISESRPQRNTKDKPLTTRKAAEKYQTSKSAVARHVKEMKLSGKPAFSKQGRGRPRNLDESEERAVIAYIIWLERAGFPASREAIEEAANKLRATRIPPAPPVGEGWFKRFMTDNPQLEKKRIIRALDRDRAGFEHGDIHDIEDFYTELGIVVENRDISASQMFNADECSIRIGVIRERLEVVIVKKQLYTKHEVVSFTNRESSTMIGCVNAAGCK